MKILPYSRPTKLVTIGFAPKDMLLQSLREAIKDQKIINGAVISGIGTLKTCHLHYVDHTGIPPRDIFYKREKPLELLNASGLIANGEPHLHIMVPCPDNETYSGHLEDKSEVL